MANEQAKTDEKQNQQAQEKEVGRDSHKAKLARRAAFPISVITPIDLLRMNPFSLMRRMTEEMDRVFGDSGLARESVGNGLWSPAIEVSEAGGNYVVRAELPGLKPEDVKVEIENDALVLQGERKFERDEEKGGVHRTEIRYGQFFRSIPLPEGANAEQVRARFENGVLEVTVPLPERKSPRKEIPIQTSSAASASAA
jgi:HSP20 family protein